MATCKYQQIKDIIIATITGCKQIGKKDNAQEQKQSSTTETQKGKKAQEKESKDEIKVFKPCEHEVIKPGIRKPDDDATKEHEEQSGEKIKQFAPCMYEKIKPGIRKPDDETDETKTESKKHHEEVCKEEASESTKIEVHLEDKNTQGSKLAVKPCPKFRNPCPDFQEATEDCKAQNEEVCEDEKHKPDEKASDKKSKDEIKMFKPCEHEHIKPGIRKPDDEATDEKEKLKEDHEEVCKEEAPKTTKTKAHHEGKNIQGLEVCPKVQNTTEEGKKTQIEDDCQREKNKPDEKSTK